MNISSHKYTIKQTRTNSIESLSEALKYLPRGRTSRRKTS